MTAKGRLTREQMAQRVARDIPDGSYVNLGIGIPTLVAEYVDPGKEVVYHTENGILGLGPVAAPGKGDPDVVNAGKQMVDLLPGAAIFHHVDSFTMIRGGHLDFAVLGALQVSEQGDLANWKVPGESVPGVGGAMDLAVGAKRVLVMTTHTTRDNQPKIVKQCTYPLTARRCVDRIYTDLAVIDVTRDGLVLRELAPGWTAAEIQELTAAPLRIEGPLVEIAL